MARNIDDLLKDKVISREEYDLMRKKAADEYYKHCEEQKMIREAKQALKYLDEQMGSFKGVIGDPKKDKMRPIVTQKMIDKAKKKLKKLQKRQRKQDMQGVSNTADQWPHELVEKFLAEPREPYTPNMIKHAKITDEMMDAMREHYGITKDSIINAPVVTERLDVSERPIVCDKPTRPAITMDEFIKFRDKMARPS